MASGGDWRKALPAAAGVEYVHNFSLIHDDIQDQSPLRRGRPTVWKKWGIAQAINAGDLMFTLAHLSVLRLSEQLDASTSLRCVRLLQETCVDLTKGQYLDMSYESERSMPLERYWPMVQGKTAALLACSCRLGAVIGGANAEQETALSEFGTKLGLAFQAWDDWLGIWGDVEITGKSTDSDLTTGKKTLPILFGLQQQTEFAQCWLKERVDLADVPQMVDLLTACGARQYTEEMAEKLTMEALKALDAACSGEGHRVLKNLAVKLLNRKN
jgi:geranylgeranyl diphosphate synthase type I